MIMQGLAALTPHAAVRIPNLHGPIRIQVRHRQGLAAESLFTLHSLTGHRTPDGTVEVERIAGFCHLRKALTNYWYDQVACIYDPGTGEAIQDLAAWAVAPLPAGTGSGMAGPPSPQSGFSNTSSRLAAAIDRAILHADAFGADDIADRLRLVRGNIQRG
jgi:hypothetical protein